MLAVLRRIPWPPAALALVLACSGAPQPVLDKQALLDRQDWWDNRDWDWYKERIPFFESPDGEIDATYYYRWELVTKHLTYGSPETGYTFTEFIDRPFWSGAYGAISCPLGHQLYEVRWLKDPRVIEDFSRYWFETPGAQPRSYSNWYGDAMWAVYEVWTDTALIRKVLPHMEQQYEGWVSEHFDAQHGMFHWVGAWDGMETNINSRQTTDSFSGADGYRPTLNAYMYADAQAIARAAALLGDSAKAREYAGRAAALKARVQQELWDPRRGFFFHQSVSDERDGIRAKSLTHETGTYAGSPHGRELIGFVPWQFGLPDPTYSSAWQFLTDTAYFSAPFGPTTAERQDPLFYVSPRCCVWSGNSWPYATTQTLVAMANLLNDYQQDVVSKDDYFTLLRTYTLTQRLGGRPYIAEAADPFTGSWEGANSYYHSEHYFHSGYVDLIITGLVGLRPRADDSLVVNPLVPEQWEYFALDDVAYHGHRVSVVWDRDGSRYGRGQGLSLFVDGRKLASAARLGRLAAVLPSAAKAGPRMERPHNFAVNNDGHPFPQISASYGAPTTPASYANDGNYWYHVSPPNRWTTVGSGSASDWIAVDFGIERPIETVKLYLLDDGEALRAPERYEVEAWQDGKWVSIPGQRRRPEAPAGHRANVVTFPTVRTSQLRLVLTHHAGSASGLTELEAWGKADLPLAWPTAPVANLAHGYAGDGAPRVAASFTSPYDRVEEINDGRIAFTRASRNRWTAYGSPNRRDWVEVDFGEPKTISRIDLYLWGDSAGVKAPRSLAVEYWSGAAWTPVSVQQRTPPEPMTWALNVVRFDPVGTARVRVLFEHDLPAFSGVTEVMVWGRDGEGER